MGTGITPNISAWLQFMFWEAIFYLDMEETWPRSEERPDRWLGVCDHIGDELTYWIYDDQGRQVLACNAVYIYKYMLIMKINMLCGT